MATIIYDHKVKNPHGDNAIVIPGSGKPRFVGLTPRVIDQGTPFDLTDGVHAYDENHQEIPFTVTPNTLDTCQVGSHVFTYTATGITQDRTITVRSVGNPYIEGNDPITVYVNTDFDPLQGITAVDGHGNIIPVELDEDLAVLTKTVDGVDTNITYIKDTLVPLRRIPLTDRQRFDGWYDNSSYTGSPITEIGMTTNKHVYAKITDLEAYASYDSSTTTFRIFTDEAGKYTNGQVIGTTTYYADWEDELNVPWKATSITWRPDVTVVRIDNVVHPVGMGDWFNGFTSLTQITGLWRVDTSAVTHMTGVFRNCSSLAKALDLTTWDTTNTRFFDNMFRGSGVTSVDMSSFVVGESADSSASMFNGCSALTTIYTAANFNMSGLRLTNAMFTGCTNLVGGAGTTYDSTKTNGQYAKVDGGSSAPGYFTER